MKLKYRSIDKKHIKERIEILKNVVIFSESDNHILKRLAHSLTEVTIPQNEAVFNKGDELNAMYIIVSGKVKVHDGEYVFTEFGEKDFFGEYSFIDSSVRSATVTATEDTVLLRLDQKNFDAIIEDNVEVSKAFLKALIKRLRNSNILEEKLTQNSVKIAHQRDKLNKQKQELEELNATKDKFFTIIAHDLKNPFNTVIGLAELLIERFETYDSKKIHEFVSQIHKFSQNTYNLLENLLEWAKSQTGKVELKKEKVDMYELTMENIYLFEENAAKKGVEILINVDVGLYALVDRNMIKTVLRNLMSNAVKYTNTGDKIQISAKKGNNVIEMCVSDTGVGIPASSIDHVLRIDSGFSTQGTDEETGTGLGLIISKEFVEKNGGTIYVKSEEGKGSQFFFTIPVYKS